MHYSTSSTTVVNPATQAERPYRMLIPRGSSSSQSPLTLSPLEGPFFAFPDSVPSPQTSSDTGSNGRRNQRSPAMEYPMAPRMRTIPLPRLSEDQFEINPLLERIPNPWIEWDLTTPPRFATLDSRRRPASQYPFSEPAIRSSSVTIRTPLSPTPIVIHHYGAVVTVVDVLTRVHEHLRECASQAINPLPMTGVLGVPQHVGMASEAQIQQALAQLLGKRSRWAGLAPSATEPDVWVLHVR